MSFKTLLVISILFCQCRSGPAIHTFSPQEIIDYARLEWNSDTSMLAFSGTMNITFRPVTILPGKYVIKYRAQGNPAQNMLPYVRIFLGNAYIYDDSIKSGTNNYIAKFEVKEETTDSLHFELRNGYSAGTERRNVILRFPLILEHY